MVCAASPNPLFAGTQTILSSSPDNCAAFIQFKKTQKKSYLFEARKCWLAGNSLLIDALGSERHHKLPQITCFSKTLFAVLKKRGQIRTIRSQEVLKETFRNPAAKPPWSCQCGLLLLGGLVLASLCNPNSLWHHSLQRQTEKDGGMQRAWEHLLFTWKQRCSDQEV